MQKHICLFSENISRYRWRNSDSRVHGHTDTIGMFEAFYNGWWFTHTESNIEYNLYMQTTNKD